MTCMHEEGPMQRETCSLPFPFSSLRFAFCVFLGFARAARPIRLCSSDGRATLQQQQLLLLLLLPPLQGGRGDDWVVMRVSWPSGPRVARYRVVLETCQRWDEGGAGWTGRWSDMPSACYVWMSVSSVPFIHGDLVVLVGMLGRGAGWVGGGVRVGICGEEGKRKTWG